MEKNILFYFHLKSYATISFSFFDVSHGTHVFAYALLINAFNGGTAVRVAHLFHNFCYISVPCPTLCLILFIRIPERLQCKVQVHRLPSSSYN